MRPSRLRVLVIDDRLPDPCGGAGAPRALALLHAIAEAGADFTLLPVMTDPENPADARRLLPNGKVALGYGRLRIGRFLYERRGKFDLIIVSRPHNMNLFRDAVAERPGDVGATPIIYDAEALFATRDAMRCKVLGAPLPDSEVDDQLKREIALADGVRAVVTVNSQSAEAFRNAGHTDVRILSHSVTPRPLDNGFDRRDGFLFVGPTDDAAAPNLDAVVWFADHALPIIRGGLKRDVSLALVGVATSPKIAARANGLLDLRGVLPDLTDVYARARVFVAPTRFASGIPVKVIDAAAHGVPVVLTPVLAEQLGWRHEDEALVAESPREFAAQCLRLHGDEYLWNRIRSRALARISRDCDPVRFNRMVADLLAQVSGQGRAH
jgi:glycosyltransferase involved in cell wall biosynthesis